MTRLTTLNLRGRFDWQQRESLILDYLHEQDPDIIFFQEAVYLPDLSPYNQATILNQDLKYPYEQAAIARLQTSPLYENYREGLAVLSKFPITWSETLILKQDSHDHLRRIVLLFDVNYHGHIVKYANIHLAQNPKNAVKHLEELLDILESRHERRIIIGDFNMPNLQDVDAWKANYTSSATEKYISFPSENTRIDYILMPKSDLLVDLSLSGDQLSDHRAVTVNITLKD